MPFRLTTKVTVRFVVYAWLTLLCFALGKNHLRTGPSSTYNTPVKAPERTTWTTSMMGQTAIEWASHQAKSTFRGAALSTTRCMQNSGSAFRSIQARKRVTAGSRSEVSPPSLIKTTAPHILPMTSIAPCWYVSLTIYSCP